MRGDTVVVAVVVVRPSPSKFAWTRYRVILETFLGLPRSSGSIKTRAKWTTGHSIFSRCLAGRRELDLTRTRQELSPLSLFCPSSFLPFPYLAPSPEFQHYFGKPAAFLVVNELFLVRIICWTEFLLPPTSFPPPSSDRFFLLLLLSLSDPFARFALSISDLLPIFTSRFALPLTRARGAALVKRGENGECNLRARFELFIGEGSSLSEWRGTSHFATHPLPPLRIIIGREINNGESRE